MQNNISKVIIIGSGPAGYTAGIYCARAGLEPILFTGTNIGGQLLQTTDIENFPGFPELITGFDLMDRMQKQCVALNTKIIKQNIKKIDFSNSNFICLSEDGTEFETQAIIVATGATAKWLNVKGESDFRGFGISGCATCDGFFYRDKTVAVVGGGNTAVEDALFLTNHAKKVYLIHRRDKLRAEEILQKRLFANEKVELIWNTVVEEFCGSNADDKKNLTNIINVNVLDGKKSSLAVDGVFVAIGHSPQSELVKGKVEINAEGYIITAPNSTKTSVDGIFAAGDVADDVYRQAITAAGRGCMAAIEAEKYLSTKNSGIV